MADISVTLPKVDLSLPDIDLTIENPFMDQTQAIAAFLKELQDKLTDGEVMIKAIQEVVAAIPTDFIDMIVSTAFEAVTNMVEVAGTALVLPVPAMPSLPDVTGFESTGEEISTGVDELAAMGEMTIADAQTEFINVLVESISSDPVLTAITKVVEKLIKSELIPTIVGIAQTAMNAVSIDDMELGSIAIPSIKDVSLPDIPDPILPELSIPPIDIDVNSVITAELKTLADFQAELMAPKIFECVPQFIQIVETAISEVEDTITSLLTTEFTVSITAAAEP